MKSDTQAIARGPRSFAGPSGLPRLLLALEQTPHKALSFSDHVGLHGEAPAGRRSRKDAALIEAVAASGLKGRGGAAFPTATKLSAVRSQRRRTAVVANCVEAEPLVTKDRVLCARVPHLVLDGARLCAEAVGAKEALVCVNQKHQQSAQALWQAIRERGDEGVSLRLVGVPEHYLAGEETALINCLNGGPALPTFGARPFERGVTGRSTLVQNAETLANIALIARYGPRWFRKLGTEAEPGSALVTMSGPVRHPGVYEIEIGAPFQQVIDAAGGTTEAVSNFLIGGYFGGWLAEQSALGVRLTRGELARLGASLGTGAIYALPRRSCGLVETARMVEYLAGERAKQCGPCTFGLAAIARAFRELAQGRADGRTVSQLRRWGQEVRGRGACHHPDGAVSLMQSALACFEHDVIEHTRGGCLASGQLDPGRRLSPLNERG